MVRPRFTTLAATAAALTFLLIATSTPAISADADGLVTEQEKILPPGAEPDSFGFSIAAAGSTLVVAQWHDAAYVYDLSVTPARLVQTLRPADGENLTYVAISGNTITVNADGAIHVYKRTLDRWKKKAVLVAPDGSGLDEVAVSGRTIVAVGGDGAHVFRRRNGKWKHKATLVATTGSSFSAIAVARKVVGAIDDGRLHVFTRQGKEWTTHPPVATSDGVDLRGGIAASPDAIVAGATTDSSIATHAGAAYVFSSDGSTWAEESKLIPNDPAEWLHAGKSVAISGDSILIGAPGFYADEDDAAYLFSRSGPAWEQSAKLGRTDADGSYCCELDYFGWSAAMTESAVVVGAMWDDEVDIDAGAVYLYRRPINP